MNQSAIHLELSGIPMRLNVADPALLNALQRTLASFNTKAPQSYINVTITTDNAPMEIDTDEDLLLDGYDEYSGTFDAKHKQAYIRLIGQHHLGSALNAIRQIISQQVFSEDGLVLHASCVAKDSEAFIFAGRSGAGKSTAAMLSSGMRIISDDLTAVRKTGNSLSAWGLPSISEYGHAQTISKHPPANAFPIRGLFLLSQDTRNFLIPVSNASAAAHLLALPRHKFEAETLGKLLELLADLTDHVPTYELHFKKDPSFWDCINNEFSTTKN